MTTTPRSSRPDVDVAVVIPAQNREDFLGTALRSVANQTVRPREVIVIDDASTDGTAAVAEVAGVQLIRRARSTGIGPARNAGIEQATSRWIAFLDSDDVWAPDHLETALAAAGEEFVLVTTAAVTTEGRALGNASPKDMVLTPWTVLESSELINTSGALVDRAAILRAGMFSDMPRAEDLQLWVRILGTGRGIAVPKVTITYTLHGNQASKDSDLMRACVEQVVAECAGEPWFEQTHAAQRIGARQRWDDLRTAQRSRDLRPVLTHAAWIARSPHAWRPLGRLLAQRRHQRRRGRELQARSASTS